MITGVSYQFSSLQFSNMEWLLKTELLKTYRKLKMSLALAPRWEFVVVNWKLVVWLKKI